MSDWFDCHMLVLDFVICSSSLVLAARDFLALYTVNITWVTPDETVCCMMCMMYLHYVFFIDVMILLSNSSHAFNIFLIFSFNHAAIVWCMTGTWQCCASANTFVLVSSQIIVIKYHEQALMPYRFVWVFPKHKLQKQARNSLVIREGGMGNHCFTHVGFLVIISTVIQAIDQK